jgi:hypothetical protein
MKIKPGAETRLDRLEDRFDVRKMSTSRLELYAAKCPAWIRERMKSMTDERLERIVNGEPFDEVNDEL